MCPMLGELLLSGLVPWIMTAVICLVCVGAHLSLLPRVYRARRFRVERKQATGLKD